MSNIEAIFQVDFKIFILYIFAIAFFIVTVVDVIGKVSEAVGKPVGWIRKRREDHELIISIANEVKELKKSFKETEEQSIKRDQKLETISAKLDEMQDKNDKAEISKMRDLLMRYYTKYGNGDEWSSLEKETFMSILSQYEDRGGDGFIHTKVVPVMDMLKVIDK